MILRRVVVMRWRRSAEGINYQKPERCRHWFGRHRNSKRAHPFIMGAWGWMSFCRHHHRGALFLDQHTSAPASALASPSRTPSCVAFQMRRILAWGRLRDSPELYWSLHFGGPSIPVFVEPQIAARSNDRGSYHQPELSENGARNWV